ncbi:MAG TPA: DUF1501 domain-containing protein, partial [Sorangium sp.]|nr:DUF1501 domain-containing protein [Sorangium sp.]
MSLLKSVTRRRMLTSLGLGTGAFLMRDRFGISEAAAEQTDPGKLPLMVFAYFYGGWDTLITLDPRDHTQHAVVGEGNIDTAYDIIGDSDAQVAAEMAATANTGLVQPSGSNIQFGPAIGDIKKHYDKICLVRGIGMGTLTHEVGRRYFITGKVPRGLSASGSAMPTVLANEGADAHAIPNLVVGGVETYNENLDAKASGLNINGYADMAKVLKPLDDSTIPNGALDKAIAEYHAKNHCIHQQLNSDGMVDTYRAGWEKARVFMQGTLWEHFNFRANPPSGGSIEKAYQAFGVNPQNPYAALRGPIGQGLIAAQALAQGVCQVVSIQPTLSLDTHFDNWKIDQVRRQRGGLDVLSHLIDFLMATEDMYHPGQALWERVTLVAFSEFARTPKLNVREGRDHHLSNACLLAGQ